MGDQLTDEEVEILKRHFYLLNPQGPKINHVPGLKTPRYQKDDGSWEEMPAHYMEPFEMTDKDRPKDDSIPPPPPEPPPPPPDEQE